jgi:ribonuclease P protein component
MDSASACARKAVARSFAPVGAKGANGLPSELRFGFPASARLKRRADFQKVYQHGFRIAGQHVVFFVARGQGRFGVTASRKVGSAVRRSRSKRRLRELYRLHRAELPAGVWDVVANARWSCATAPWHELERDFAKLCAARRTQHGAAERRG